MNTETLFKNFISSLFPKKRVGKSSRSSQDSDYETSDLFDSDMSEIDIFGDGNNNDVSCSENDSSSECSDSSGSGND